LPAAGGPGILASMSKPLPIDRCQHLIRLLGWTWGHCGPDDGRGTGYSQVIVATHIPPFRGAV